MLCLHDANLLYHKLFSLYIYIPHRCSFFKRSWKIQKMERKSTDCWWKPCDLLMIRRWCRVVMLWLQRIIGALNKTSNDYGMKINFKKTKSASPVYQTSSASLEWQAPALCCSLTDKEISLRPAVQCKSPHHSRRLQRRTIDDFADLRDI